jgi:hypothetical protein
MRRSVFIGFFLPFYWPAAPTDQILDNDLFSWLLVPK